MLCSLHMAATSGTLMELGTSRTAYIKGSDDGWVFSSLRLR